MIRWLLFAFLIIFYYNVNASDLLIGSGEEKTVYNATANIICALINMDKDSEIRCINKTSKDFIQNVSDLKTAKLDLILIPSDRQKEAYINGIDGKKYNNLRFLLSLNTEPLTLIVRSDSDIKSFDDIEGKILNIGAPESNAYNTLKKILKHKGWKQSDLLFTTRLLNLQQVRSLCRGEIDVMALSMAYPNDIVSAVDSLCDIGIIPLSDPDIKALVATNKEYSMTTIAANIYKNIRQPVTTIASKTTLLATTDMDEKTAYYIVKRIFSNLDKLKKNYPIFMSLNSKDMVNIGQFAPLHKGAKKYFQEKKLLLHTSADKIPTQK